MTVATDSESAAPPARRGPSPAAVARNALSSGGRYAVPAVLALLVTPYALRVLGEDRFGLWALAGVVLTMSRVLDLGLQRAMVRAVAQGEGSGDRARSIALLAAGRGAMACMGVAYVCVVWLVRDLLVADVLRLPPELWAEGRVVLVGTAAVAAVEAVFAPFQAAMDGIGRMDASSAVDAVQRSASAVGVVIVLGAGWGLPGLVAKNLATGLAAGAAYRAILGRLAPDLAHAPVALSTARLRQLLTFGRHVQLVNVSALLVDAAAKTMLGRSAGVSSVALYELALRVVNQTGGALMAAAAAVFPAAAEIGSAAGMSEATSSPAAPGDATAGAAWATATPPVGAADARLRALYFGATRYLAWLVVPAYALMAALAVPFVRAWLGAGYGAVSASMVALSAGYVVGVLAAPAHMVAQASGRERLSSAAALATVVVALAGIALLLPRFGLAGVVAAVSVGVAMGGALAWALFARAFRTGWRTVGCIGGRGPLAAAVGAVAAGAATVPLPETLLGVAVSGALGASAVAAALVLTGAIGPDERAAIGDLLRVLPGTRAGRA